MKLAFIADGRAEHARRWVRCFAKTDDVVLLSTYPCDPIDDVRLHILPGVFRPGDSFVKSSEQSSQDKQKSMLGRLVKVMIKYGVDSLIRPIWQRVSCVDVIWQRRSANRLLREFNPDLVHALRIPNETFVLAGVSNGPKIASVWGQDFIYNCRHYVLHRWLTRRALPRLNAITADCRRDLNLSLEFGYQGEILEYFPTNGGVDTLTFSAGTKQSLRKPLVVYARGFGPYLRPDVLFEAFARQLSKCPDLFLKIIAPESQHEFMNQRMKHFKIPPESHVVLPFLSQADWASLLQEAMTFVSPSLSDGTPNGMLEAMACGTVPIVGNIESIREWVEDGKNGLTFDPESVDELEVKLSECLSNHGFRERCESLNREIILNRCARKTMMPKIRTFYQSIICKSAKD